MVETNKETYGETLKVKDPQKKILLYLLGVVTVTMNMAMT